MSTIDCVGGRAVSTMIGALLVLCGTAAAMADTEGPALTVCGPEASATRARPRMLEMQFMLDAIQNTTGRSACFSPNSTPEQIDQIMRTYNMLPPTIANMDPRFRTSSPVWTGNGNQTSTNGTATKTNLTYSFPNDGVSWDGGSNTLSANLTTTFGSLDRGREFIRQGLASWRRFNGLSYTEVQDDNVAFTQSTINATSRGNTRIGARAQDGVFGVLAYNYFPSGGSDMVLDANEFVSNSFGATGNNYRTFRNTIAHEHGHGLSAIHTVPCNSTKLMEPQLATAFDGTQLDDIRFAARNYGDKYAGNQSGATATDFGNLTTPAVRSVIERNLSTNGTAGANNTDEDWFRFTIDSAQNVVISVDPTGGSYTEGQQSSGCTGTTATVNAEAAGNLNVELRNGANGATVLQTASAAAAGAVETLTANNLAAGTYWVRVVDVGPNTSANQFVQLYNMTVRVGTSKARPFAIAGLHKRVAAGTACHFMGNINSYAVDTTTGTNPATITGYAWDLDGDGVFGGAEDSSISQTSKTYVSNGVYPVTLRVTDSNGQQGTDTINVTVFNATASISGVSPTNATAGNIVPLVITGTNFKGVTSASQVTLTGTGVTVIGTPVVNAMGTQITGLSLDISGGAPNGVRDLTITNSDGSGTTSGNATRTGAITIGGPCVAPNISNTLSAQNACTGSQVTFTLNTTGTNLNYDWRRDGATFGAPNQPTLTLNNVQVSDSANYYCIVSNPCGTRFSNFALLTVFESPAITGQPQSQSICGGGSATFTLSLSSLPVSYQWRKDGVAIPNSDLPSITITNATSDDQGDYDCLIDTGCQVISSGEATLTVGTAPSISAQPLSSSVCEGASVQLSVVASGATGYQWRKNLSNIQGATGSILLIDPATSSDQGSYDCVVTGACSSTISDAAIVSVGASPQITQQPLAQASCRGGSVTLSVTASGASGFQWRRNTVDVSGATSATLVLNPVNASNTGSYDCVVSGVCTSVMSNAVTVTSCPADFSCNGTLEVQDIFDFLNAWFAGAASADYNGTNGVTIQDIFDFLNGWFAGCGS